MRKQTYEEARVLQEIIETLKGENDMLEDLSQQLEKKRKRGT